MLGLTATPHSFSSDDLESTRKLADQGDAKAQYRLGVFYNGEGVPKDYVLAYMWVNLSLAEDNNIKAKESIDNLEKEMTPEQIEEAQKLSREWFNKRNNLIKVEQNN